MKKIILSLTIILSLLILTGCQEEKGNYELIELQGRELINYLMESENKNIAVALCFEEQENTDSFMDSLRKAVTSTGYNIYYVNMNHIDEYTLETIPDYVASDYTKNSYFVYKNDAVVAANVYSSFTSLLRDIKNLRVPNEEIPRISREEKLSFLEEADKELEKGNVSYALDYVNRAWDLDEAKDKFDNTKLYFLIGAWESYYSLDKTTNKVKYVDLVISYGFQDIDIYEEENVLDEIEKPHDIDYKAYYYRVEDNIIYIKKNKTDKKDKPKYKISYITYNVIELEDLEDNKIHTFIRREW